MVVSDTYKFIFIHNLKCAGSSIRRALMPMNTTNNFFWHPAQKNGLSLDKAHIPLAIIKTEFPDYFQKLLSYFSFMCVRNPYTKAISAFNQANQSEFFKFKKKNLISEYSSSLNSFLENLDEVSIRSFQLQHIHFVRQVDMAYVANTKVVNHTLKFESLPTCFESIRIFKPEIADILINKCQYNNAKPISVSPVELLSKNSIEKIQLIYEKDFEVFEYPMDI